MQIHANLKFLIGVGVQGVVRGHFESHSFLLDWNSWNCGSIEIATKVEWTEEIQKYMYQK